MSLAHAILGLLTITPMTGYELKRQAFTSTVAHFWQADQAQIYRTLNTLSEAGWVEVRLEIQDARPNRKVYHITQAGTAALDDWLRTPQPLPVHREPFLVQLFFAGRLENAAILEQINHQRVAHQALLERYHEITLVMQNDSGHGRDMHFWRMTLDMGIDMERMYLAWLERCEALIRTLGEQADSA